MLGVRCPAWLLLPKASAAELHAYVHASVANKSSGLPNSLKGQNSLLDRMEYDEQVSARLHMSLDEIIGQEQLDGSAQIKRRRPKGVFPGAPTAGF